MGILGGNKKKGSGDPQPAPKGGSGGSGESKPYTMEEWRKERERNRKEAKDFEEFVDEHEVGKKDDGGKSGRK
jgi:hypothetical protein